LFGADVVVVGGLYAPFRFTVGGAPPFCDPSLEAVCCVPPSFALSSVVYCALSSST
jgi:hypothetical protein